MEGSSILINQILQNNSENAIRTLRRYPQLANQVFTITNEFNIDGLSGYGVTPLILASYCKNSEVVEELLKQEYNVQVNFRTS